MIEATITDRKALASRSPSELALYLRAHNWVLGEHDNTTAVWTKSVDGEDFEALQPLESTFRDYALRVRDIIQVAAVVEQQSELDVLHNISNISTDIHSIRTFPAGGGPGTIGLDDGVAAFESLRNMIVAAAYSVSATQPRAVQPARKPTEVLKYLRDVRIGPTSEGSFVLTVLTAVPPRLTLGQDSLFDGENSAALEPAEPYERRVSLRIYDAAQAAHDAANDALVKPDGLESFTKAVRRGISANFCEALVGLGGEAGNPFEISLALAPSRPLARKPLTPIRFRRDHLPVLAAAAQELRERTADEGVQVVGNVVRLHREGSGLGEIGIAGNVEGDDRLRRVWIDLSTDDYALAVRAHEEMLSVSVRGDLVRRGTRNYLAGPTAFRLLPEGDG
jgi:hypothetical protein